MRIVIDLDGTICELKNKGGDYGKLKINPKAVSKLTKLKQQGHYIILQTARHMKTCESNQGKVLAKIGKKTFDWLSRKKIPYDEIYFGKPFGDVYIDDLSYEFHGWDDLQVEDFDDNFANILIPMAGLGSRFTKAGFDTPKPLIKVLGEEMIKWSMRSFNFLKNLKMYRFIFVVLEEHQTKYNLSRFLKEEFGKNSAIITIEKPTRGQAETCLYARKYINNYNRLFLYNCDTYSLSDIWEVIEYNEPDGVIACFNSNDNRYSYAKTDRSGHVIDVAEKKVISNLASNGMYYFKRGRDFVWAADNMIKTKIHQKNEYFVIPTYKELINIGKKIMTAKVTKNWILGTPEELKHFEQNFRKNS